MKNYLKLLVRSGVLLVWLLNCGTALALPEVAGLLGLETEGEPGYLAIRVQVPENQALQGLMWYNNDQQVVFPEVLVGTGYPDGPGLVAQATLLAEDVSGGSSQWCQLTFPDPVGATQEALYVVFTFNGETYQAEGAGGGPALGYVFQESPASGWVSGDGEFWASLDPAYSFAIQPQFVPYTEGMVLKSLNSEDGASETPPPLITKTFLKTGPNPFNPKIQVQWGLPAAQQVSIKIFDLRGHLVQTLVDAPFKAGYHQASWLGRDSRGQGVSSGVYFIRMTAGPDVLTKRVMLLR
jgi:hypothetical protein|nr:FlgD immunoglobulin-like domain containing protein [Candidatus Krumholzibacteria bacterium]